MDLIGKLTNDYANIIENINDLLDNTTSITDEHIDQIRDCLWAKYERQIKGKRSNNRNENNNSNEGEGSFPSISNFKGRCFKCGHYGHKGIESKLKNKDNIKCYKCGEMGHFKYECPKGNNGNSQRSETAATNSQ